MEKVKLKELVDIYLGVTHTPKYVKEGVPFLSVKDISNGKICFDDCKYISQQEYDSLSEGAKPKIGDMLFCRVGTLGKPIIIPKGTPLFGSFVSLGYLRNRDANRCNLNYLKYWMYSNSFWDQVDSNVKGASQVNLNTGWLSKFNIDLPDIEEQNYRISVLDKCKLLIKHREDELKKLDDLIKARFVEMF
ncbi:MAG: restriction endonuclease subunit S, partial [Erysipelotrichaceae bacterium]|nr:restriction endonuclease subunit S [Erysipelotrichaceae bacterium]